MGDHVLHKIIFFRAPRLGQKGPRPSRNPNPDPGVPKWVPWSNISKLRTEKPCRMQWSIPQTEPYVASYGRKPFRAGWGKIRVAGDTGNLRVAERTLPQGLFPPGIPAPISGRMLPKCRKGHQKSTSQNLLLGAAEFLALSSGFGTEPHLAPQALAPEARMTVVNQLPQITRVPGMTWHDAACSIPRHSTQQA